MKQWQKAWLIIISAIAIAHLFRDVSQDMGIKNALSTPFVKVHPNFTPYWFKYTTYPYEILTFLLSMLLLRKNKFGVPGYITLLASMGMLGGWMIYWVYL